MKVFTVGLDQKPPVKEETLPEKPGADSPPPGYAPASGVHLPLPQMSVPIAPTYMVRKSRGYKGILMVMLAVFLMAIFALTLSEIAYNRHREENYFRLRWAELKHRLGYGRDRSERFRGGPFDYYGRSAYGNSYGSDRFFGNRNRELSDPLILQPIQPIMPESTTTTPPPPSSSPVQPVPEEQPPPMFIQPQIQSSSFERPADPGAMIRDARLRFLKNILQRIKQRAEAMGFDGTMQVSVIEVEPQVIESSDSSSQKPSPFLQPPSFPNPPSLSFNSFFNRPNAPSLDPKSNAFLDGFGEIHQPTLFQQNQFIEHQRQAEQNQQQQQQHGNGQNGPWSAGGNGVQEEIQPAQQQNVVRDFGEAGSPNFFRPQWQMISPHQPPHIQLQRPPAAFDRWSSQSGAGVPAAGSDGNSGQQQSADEPPPPPMVIPLFGAHGQGQGQVQQNQQVPKAFEGVQSGNGQAGAHPNGNASPSQEVVGEIYGRKFGRMLQDIIANRIQGFQQMGAPQKFIN